jgi:hypothetical protein
MSDVKHTIDGGSFRKAPFHALDSWLKAKADPEDLRKLAIASEGDRRLYQPTKSNWKSGVPYG